jgi:hypothetical protein
MKKRTVLLLAVAVTLAGCSKYGDEFDEYMQEQEIQGTIDNATKIFGEIDPNQDWNSVNSGSITVTANANLNDIVKVQVLTESPFFNSEAKVLCEAPARNGDVVTLKYDAPNCYSQLVAACVNSKGVYHIQVFDVNATSVKFSTANAARVTRASSSEAPTFTSIILRAPKKSFNAMRTEKGESCTIGGNTYTQWANSGWQDELMWEPADGQTFDNGWKMDTEKNRGFIYREIGGFADGEEANVKAILDEFLAKRSDDKYSNNGKKNNIRLIRTSKYFMLNNNYVYTDGVNPLTLIPIQIWTTEFKMDHVFYYYYKPEDIPASMTEVDYIKTLPKYKAIQVERVTSTANATDGVLLRKMEFLLPFYKEAPHEGEVQASAIFPAGYKVGFLNMKHQDNNYDITKNNYGCTYGDGRLNYAVNHIKGHFLSAMDKSIGGNTLEGMQFEDPRIALFTANNKTYMCFEDGSDCNFCDIVLEIGGGIANPLEETPEVEAQAYTMCFEDRPQTADYDLNDVVLRCIRIDDTTLEMTLVATGADDDVVIKGANGWAYNNREVHELFGATEPDKNGNRFVNTVKGGVERDVVSGRVTVDKGKTIPEYLRNIYIENRTTGRTITLAKQGDYPYAIIVPQEFCYPAERTTITGAYQKFLEWAKSAKSSTDWYVHGNADKYFPSLFIKLDY